ncbi:MAG TPA: polysaccharide biosynthesis tyrosine autokinase [Pirellulales bacterium]|nr:polysaccharide biosynthesis tyrosine autokinase [Pirellulales bacterium]
MNFDELRSADPLTNDSQAGLPRAAGPSVPARIMPEPTAIDWPEGASTVDMGQAEGLSLSTLWHGFRRRCVLALGVGLVVSAAAGLSVFMILEPQYTATAYLRIASTEPRLVSGAASSNSQEFDVYKRTQKELVLGRFVLQAALRSPQVASIRKVQEHLDPAAWLGRELKVDFPGGAEIMSISMSGANATEAAALVNAVMDAYIHEVVEVEAQQERNKLDKLTEANERTIEESRKRRDALRERVDAVGTGDSQALTLKQQIALQRYATLQGEHTRVELELNEAEVELDDLRRQAATNADPVLPADEIERAINSDPRVAEQRARVSEIARRLAETKAAATEEVGQVMVQKYTRRLAEAKQTLADWKAEARKLAQQTVKEAMTAQRASEIDHLEHRVTLLKQRGEKLKHDLSSAEDDAGMIGASSVDIEIKRAEIDQLDELSRRLGREIETLRVDLMSPRRITELSRAEAPAFKDKSRQLRGTIMVAVVGLVVPVLAISWFDARAQRVYVPVGTQQVVGIRVLGALPLLPSNRPRLSLGRKNLPAVQMPMAFRESIDGLRTMLLREAELSPTQVVMVTSAMGGEGKTSLACQLAWSIARARYRCLLIDFDLRRPAAHGVLDMPVSPGMCEVLRGEADLRDVIQPTRAANLSFIAAGELDDEAQIGLTQQHLADCFAALRPEFDFIVVDTSPILPVVDALLVAKHVDAAILSVFCDVSQAPKIQLAYSRLVNLGVNVLGSVVTGSHPTSMYGYGHAYRENSA